MTFNEPSTDAAFEGEESAPGTAQSASVRLKLFAKKHKKAIILTAAVAVASAAAITVALVLRNPDAEDASEDGAPDQAPPSGDDSTPRASPVEHLVKAALVQIAGQASERARANRAAAFAAGLVDTEEIPDGYTHRVQHSRGTAA